MKNCKNTHEKQKTKKRVETNKTQKKDTHKNKKTNIQTH